MTHRKAGSSDRRKTSRKECWARAQSRKDCRRSAQADAAKRNAGLRAEGRLTPWQAARAARRARRHPAAKVS